jgi:hypothetical protein
MTRKTAPAAPTFATREEWLLAATAELSVIFESVGETLPSIRVSVGWPGGRGKKGNVIGQCWAASAAADNVSQVFISPTLADAERVLDVLAHELVHAVDDCQSGHKGRFAKIAKAIGLTGKMTETVAGDDLKAELCAIVQRIGAYPHAALAGDADGADGPKKQGTRMLKVECDEDSGYVVRMTRKWLDEYGAPKCPCHDVVMVEAV